MVIGKNLEYSGFEIINDVYSETEVIDILKAMGLYDIEHKFGVREFLIDKPKIRQLIFNERLMEVIQSLTNNSCKLIKSIYFDKPPNANWIVNWHQDLTVNLTEKRGGIKGFKNWRVTDNRVVVQPPTWFLESIFTIRVHLDGCTKENGALRVIEKSHKRGVIEVKDWVRHGREEEKVCDVERGGVLIMKPLILHSSRRSENKKNRRVIHMEFTDQYLPEGLSWKEKISIKWD